MKITIEAKPKEIADLVANLQDRPSISILPERESYELLFGKQDPTATSGRAKDANL